MSESPFKDALDKLGSGGDGLSITAGHDSKHDTQVTAEVSVSPGKWTMSAAWTYAKDVGNAALGKITWRP